MNARLSRINGACSPYLRGFAQDAKITEVNGFSIAVDPAYFSRTDNPAMETHSGAFSEVK
jgi:hypothetical protein